MKVRTIAMLAAIAVVVAGCGGTVDPGGPTLPPGSIVHAQGSDDLVIQVDNEGGFVAPSYTMKQIPQFTLFGDGGIFTPGVEPAIYPGPALPSIERQELTEEGLQAILARAIAAGLKDGTDYTDFGSTQVADAGTTVFTFAADGVRHTVKVYALSQLSERPDGMSTQEFQARQALEGFLNDLGTLEQWLPAGSLGDASPYTGEGARVFVSAYQPDAQLQEPAQRWPLVAALGSFGDATGFMDTRCGIVTAQDWSATLQPRAKSANELTPWTSDGQRYSISFRPLLPNETTC
jgi:hypothetical protein